MIKLSHKFKIRQVMAEGLQEYLIDAAALICLALIIGIASLGFMAIAP